MGPNAYLAGQPAFRSELGQGAPLARGVGAVVNGPCSEST